MIYLNKHLIVWAILAWICLLASSEHHNRRNKLFREHLSSRFHLIVSEGNRMPLRKPHSDQHWASASQQGLLWNQTFCIHRLKLSVLSPPALARIISKHKSRNNFRAEPLLVSRRLAGFLLDRITDWQTKRCESTKVEQRLLGELRIKCSESGDFLSTINIFLSPKPKVIS